MKKLQLILATALTFASVATPALAANSTSSSKKGIVKGNRILLTQEELNEIALQVLDDYYDKLLDQSEDYVDYMYFINDQDITILQRRDGPILYFMSYYKWYTDSKDERDVVMGITFHEIYLYKDKDSEYKVTAHFVSDRAEQDRTSGIFKLIDKEIVS